MMLTAMHHLGSSATHASPSSASASPWQQQQQQLFPAADRGHLRYDYDDLASVPAAPPAHHKQQHRAAPRVTKRQARPSRRLPTTYISADPADFRRMVQQVTGADDDALPPPQEEKLFCGPALAGHAGAAPSMVAGALLLPTLDTSAFLLGRVARPAAARTEQAAPPPACDGSLELDNASGSSNGGFPTLESSWDLL